MIQDEATESDITLSLNKIKFLLDSELKDLGDEFKVELDKESNLIIESLVSSSC